MTALGAGRYAARMSTRPERLPADAAPPARDLPRVLGALSAASILIGAVIGSGIFQKPSAIAVDLPSPGWILVCWIAAGALALIGSLVFAELGSRYPQAGGQYTFIRASFGDLPAFLFGWTNLLVINAAGIAALAFVSAEYLFNLIPVSLRPAAGSHWFKTVPALLIAALTATNAAGVRWGAGLQNLLTGLKLAALGLIVAGLFAPGKTVWPHLGPIWEMRGDPSAAAIRHGFAGAFLATFWAYDGWYQLSFSGGEIRDPRRNIPLGFVLGIVVVLGVYVAANIAYFGVLGLDEMSRMGLAERAGMPAAHGGVGGFAAFRLFGPAGVTLISIGIACSTFGAANASILTGPRLSFAMARDGLFFRRLGDVHVRWQTPLAAIVVQGGLAVACVYAGSFHQLTDSAVFAAWIFYLLTILSYFRLRAERHAEGIFRSPGYPVLPAVFVVFAAVFLVYSLVEAASLAQRYLRNPADHEAADGLYLIVVVAIILAGVPAYRLLRRGCGRGANIP